MKAIGSTPDKTAYPNVYRYYTHITSFKASATAKWGAGIAAATTAAAAVAAPAAAAAGAGGNKKAAADDSDDDSDMGDLFGDSDDDGAVEAAAPAPAPAAKKAKKKKIEKTQLTFYANPVDSEVSMDEMEAAIRGIVIDGLRWGDAFGIEDIAFGLQRIHAQCVIVNDLVGLDDVTDAVEALPQVGSTAPGTMNRLG